MSKLLVIYIFVALVFIIYSLDKRIGILEGKVDILATDLERRSKNERIP